MNKLTIAICSVSICAATGIAVLSIGGASGAISLFPESKVEVEFRNYDDSFLYRASVRYGSSAVYEGAKPTRPEDAQYTYVFTSWDLPTTAVTEPMVYHAQFFSSPKEFKVTFQNYDHSELFVDYVTYGQASVYEGPTPTRPADAQYHYVFSKWDRDYSKIVEDTIVTAVYETQDVLYTVTFANEDGKVLYADQVRYGDAAAYKGLTPVKRSTATIAYQFSGWDKDLSHVVTNFTTVALYQEVPALYQVQFLNYNGDLLYTDHVGNDGTATYFGMTPTQPSTAQYIYAFAGWNKTLEHIKSDLVVTARFSKETRQYLVTFKNYDGTVLDTVNVAYSGQAAYTKPVPTRPMDDHYTYTFSGWDRDLAPIVSDLDVFALYTKALRIFTVTFNNYDGSFLEKDPVEYGSTAVYFGATPVREGDALHTYVFDGWDKELTNITADTTFTAKFRLNENGGGLQELIHVVFANYNGIKLDGDFVNKGETAYYRSPDLPKRSPAYVDRFGYLYYNFVSWDKADLIVSCQDNMTTYAQYTASGYLIVTYRGQNDVLLYEDYVTKGQNSTYQGPTKDYLLSSNGFKGWSKSTLNVTESLTVYPTYEDSL